MIAISLNERDLMARIDFRINDCWIQFEMILTLISIQVDEQYADWPLSPVPCGYLG